MICRSFEPITAEDARLLIVGSMPSVRSLEQAQYYAHPRNAFWPILFDCFGELFSTDYENRKNLILSHHLALWDAAACCEREGSLDSAMREISYNDFASLWKRCPHIQNVLCNGQTAYSLFMKSGTAENRSVLRMPSTSPAYTLSYESKKSVWKEALERYGIL